MQQKFSFLSLKKYNISYLKIQNKSDFFYFYCFFSLTQSFFIIIVMAIIINNKLVLKFSINVQFQSQL
ncbi:hypothetical protein pb186bvf_020751 [Paramecium bursaria]